MRESMSTYNQVLSQVESLTPDEQLRLIEELTALVRSRVTPQSQHSILELEGLGKEIWNGIDAQEYVNRERGKCNG